MKAVGVGVVEGGAGGGSVDAFWVDAICIPQLEGPGRYKTLERCVGFKSARSRVYLYSNKIGVFKAWTTSTAPRAQFSYCSSPPLNLPHHPLRIKLLYHLPPRPHLPRTTHPRARHLDQPALDLPRTRQRSLRLLHHFLPLPNIDIHNARHPRRNFLRLRRFLPQHAPGTASQDKATSRSSMNSTTSTHSKTPSPTAKRKWGNIISNPLRARRVG